MKKNETNTHGQVPSSVLTPGMGVGVLGSFFSSFKAGLSGVLDSVDNIATRIAQDTPIGQGALINLHIELNWFYMTVLFG